jgi:hypothetical protein
MIKTTVPTHWVTWMMDPDTFKLIVGKVRIPFEARQDIQNAVIAYPAGQFDEVQPVMIVFPTDEQAVKFRLKFS